LFGSSRHCNRYRQENSERFCQYSGLHIYSRIIKQIQYTRKGNAMKIGDIIHFDVDDEQWGRVASDGEIMEDKGSGLYLVEAYSIRANILVHRDSIQIPE